MTDTTATPTPSSRESDHTGTGAQDRPASERMFRVTIEGPDGRREVIVPSPTTVQASDAAAIGARPGEGIIDIQEVDAGDHLPGTASPPTQAQATPGPGAAR